MIPGVAECRLDIGRSLATVVWNPDSTNCPRWLDFSTPSAIPATPSAEPQTREIERRADRGFLIRIAVAGAVAGNIMLLAFALYGGAFHGIETEYEQLFRWVSMVLSLPSVFWCANVFYRGAWGSLRTRTLHMDVPISVGILAGFGWGCANTIRGQGEIYFDSVTVLIFLLLVGRFVQRRQQRSAARATELLFSLAPTVARLIVDDEIREVPSRPWCPVRLVELRAGDTAPADGVVMDGFSTVDRSLLTGESRPVEVTAGDPVHAGTVNLSGRLLMEVRTTGENTRVGRLMRMVEENARRRAPVVRLADRISGWFVLAVLSLALATLLIWLRLDPEHAVDHAVALLIVSCPCALGLATPLAVAAAVGRAARRGILIKGGDALEELARTGRMILDKTGTITEGRMAVVRWTGDEWARSAAARDGGPILPSHRLGSVHRRPHEPTPCRGGLGPPRPGPDRHLERPVHGGGVTRVRRGAGRSAQRTRFQTHLSEVVKAGLTPVAVAADGEVVAVAALGDKVRDDAAASLERIRDMGWSLEVLSGDHPSTVATRGLRGSASKGAAVPTRSSRRSWWHGPRAGGRVVMVGDGVNDAAALAAATVGVGVHGGAEAALAAADVYLSRPGLSPVVELLEGSRRTLGVIRRNLVFSLGYNLVAVSLAMAGLMHPLVAAILMPLSSITVVVSSYRAKTF